MLNYAVLTRTRSKRDTVLYCTRVLYLYITSNMWFNESYSRRACATCCGQNTNTEPGTQAWQVCFLWARPFRPIKGGRKVPCGQVTKCQK